VREKPELVVELPVEEEDPLVIEEPVVVALLLEPLVVDGAPLVELALLPDDDAVVLPVRVDRFGRSVLVVSAYAAVANASNATSCRLDMRPMAAVYVVFK
jgi:hypothetical protein